MSIFSKKSLIFSILTIVLVIVISMSVIAYADDDDTDETPAQQPPATTLDNSDYEREELEEDTVSEEDKTMFPSVNEAIAGTIRSFAFSIFNLVQGGVKGTYEVELVTIDDLVFDRFPGTSIDFYNNNNPDSFTGNLKENISTWYGKFRVIAISCYAIFVLYIGIRILLVVGGEKQKKYKEFLMTWIQGFLLLILFPYGLKLAIDINSSFVHMIEDETKESLGIVSSPMVGDFENIKDPNADEDNESIAAALSQNPFAASSNNYMAAQANRAEAKSDSISDAFILLIMVFQFIILLITYYKRLFMVGFLITIFPIVMILYPIDKVGDGSAQSFDMWTKELFTNIFMQTFQALAYIFIIGVASNGSSANDWLLSIVGVTFLFKAEEIIKTLLGFKGTKTGDSPAKTLAQGVAVVGVATSVANSVARTGRSVVEGAREIKAASDMGYNPLLLRRSSREGRLAESHRVLAQLEPSYTTPPERLTLTPVDVSGGADSSEIDDYAEILAGAAGEEVGSLDDVEVIREEKLTQVGDFIFGNTRNPLLAQALEKHGLTQNGSGSLELLGDARGDFISGITKLDKGSKTYQQDIKTLQQEFTARVRVALPNLDEVGVQKFSQAAMMGFLAVGGELESVPGNGYVKNTGTNPLSIKKSFERETGKFIGDGAVMDFSRMGERRRNGGAVFAQVADNKETSGALEGKTALRGRAREEYQSALAELNGDGRLSGFSEVQKQKVAHAIAVTRTFGAQSKLTPEQQYDNLRALGGHETDLKPITNPDGSSTGRAEIRPLSVGQKEVMQMFTAEEVQESAELIASFNLTSKGVLDDILADKDSSIFMGATSQDILKITDEAVVQFAGTPESSSISDKIMGSNGEITLEIKEKQAVLDESRLALKRAIQKAKERQSIVREQKVKKGSYTRKEHANDEGTQVDFEYTLDSLEGKIDVDAALLANRTVMQQLEDATEEQLAATYQDPISIDLENTRTQINDIMGEGTAATYTDTIGPDGDFTRVSYEEYLRNQAVSNLTGFIEERVEENVAAAIRQNEAELQHLQAAKVDGLTEQQYINEAKEKARRGTQKIAGALGGVVKTGAAAVTIGPLAIGLDTGLDPISEWAGATFGASKLLNRDTGKRKIKVKNEFGKIETVEVDKGVIEDIALAFRDTGIEAGEKIYDIQDLRQHVRNDLVLTSIESQLNVGNRARSKQETNAIEQREEDIRSGKTAEVFRNNLRNRRR